MNSISETAYAVAMYRALETERPDALFLDRYARFLAGGRGELLVKVLGNERQIANVIAVRTHLIDESIKQLVEAKSIDTVLNLAAGLDMRPYRLALLPKLRWIEVDLPDICEYKTQKLCEVKPSCILERFKLDLTDITSRNALFSTINSHSQKVLILTEGLLSYLSEMQVKALAADLQQQANFRWWLFELVSSDAFKCSANDWSQKIANQYFSDGAPIFQYTPEGGAEFFQTIDWKIAQVRYMGEESRRLKRGVGFAGVLPEFLMRRFAKKNWEALRQQNRIILLERQSFR
jgi:methyltransferase (TIGR00027 family)